MEARIIRETFGPDFLIGASTHSIEEARKARDGGADFAVFGPVFDTPSKLPYGDALGLNKLEAAAQELSPFPLIAIGGVTLENATQVLRAGANGIAAIRLFSDTDSLEAIAQKLRSVPPAVAGG
jgi:thiamine-phosphate pyrophosphorylase